MVNDSKQKKYQHLAFDFDGTLADSFYLAREYYDLAAKDSGIDKLTEEQIEEMRNRKLNFKNAWKVVKDLDIGFVNLARLSKNILEELLFNKQRLKLFKQIPAVLEELKNRGYTLYIVTYNQQLIVENTLKKFNCLDKFEAIYALDLFKNKSEKIEELLENFSINKNEIIYIGDEVKDIETAHNVGIDALAVEWGYNSSQALKKYNPQYQVKKIPDILKIFE
jgi:HAD superfamily hydrolase (TIGR01549 family)